MCIFIALPAFQMELELDNGNTTAGIGSSVSIPDWFGMD